MTWSHHCFHTHWKHDIPIWRVRHGGWITRRKEGREDNIYCWIYTDSQVKTGSRFHSQEETEKSLTVSATLSNFYNHEVEHMHPTPIYYFNVIYNMRAKIFTNLQPLVEGLSCSELTRLNALELLGGEGLCEFELQTQNMLYHCRCTERLRNRTL